MVRINGSVARCCLRRSRSLAVSIGSALLALTGLARANETVSLRSANLELEPLLNRLGSELASAGYSIRYEHSDEPLPCRALLAPSPAGMTARERMDGRNAWPSLPTGSPNRRSSPAPGATGRW